MAKPIQYCKVINLQLKFKKIILKNKEKDNVSQVAPKLLSKTKQELDVMAGGS